ncbi:MAG: serine/threonine-protein phosphatase [Bacteroidia bacterium]|nr:serine/threonine-protein phosphatase [Bacteroidia bacterium]
MITVADCTGHGVPGAFMSMLGISFLNEIVRKEEVTKASDVLNHLRQHVIDSLRQKGISGEQKDGMDIALAVMDTETKKLQFAGAYNPLWLIRHENILRIDILDNPEDAITEIRGNKMPVAIHIIMEPFQNFEVDIEPGDTFYLFSDGYADQFGGERGKKFMSRPLKRLLMKNQKLSMQEQAEVLDKTIEEWKAFINPATGKHFEQTDDITVIGVRI